MNATNPQYQGAPSKVRNIAIPSYVDVGDFCLHYTAELNHIWPEHVHEHHQIIIVPESNSECELSWLDKSNSRKNIILNGQYFIYIEKHIAHAFRTGRKGVYISLGISAEEATKLAERNMWSGVRISQWWKIIKQDTFIWNIVQLLRSYCYQKIPPPILDLSGLARTLASHLFSLEKNRTATLIGGLTPIQLRNVEIYIEQHFRDRISVEEIADVVGLHKDHFSQLFKTSTGFSPHRYIIALRLEYVRRLKQMGKMTSAQIAAEAGFYDESHLSHTIKQFCKTDSENSHGILLHNSETSNEENP